MPGWAKKTQGKCHEVLILPAALAASQVESPLATPSIEEFFKRTRPGPWDRQMLQTWQRARAKAQRGKMRASLR